MTDKNVGGRPLKSMMGPVSYQLTDDLVRHLLGCGIPFLSEKASWYAEAYPIKRPSGKMIYRFRVGTRFGWNPYEEFQTVEELVARMKYHQPWENWR